MRGPLAVLPVWGILVTVPPGPAPQDTFQIIVNATNPVEVLPSAAVADLFLRTRREWDNGSPALPVDQSLSSAVRIQFVRDVLGQSRGEIQDYWLRRMFSGREVPPPVRESDSAVIDYVRANAGAIGYVSGPINLPAGVKHVRVAR